MMIKNIFILAAFGVFLISCAGLQTVSQYNYIKPVQVDVSGKCFAVSYLESKSSMWVNVCPVSDAGSAFVEGLTLGIVDTTPPQKSHEEAAKKYIQKEGLDCTVDSLMTFRISDGMGGSHGYEVKVNC